MMLLDLTIQVSVGYRLYHSYHCMRYGHDLVQALVVMAVQLPHVTLPIDHERL